jgi:hypothetical protein
MPNSASENVKFNLLQRQIAELTERVLRLEQLPQRTKRGRAKHGEAAKYLGYSDEWLRQQNQRGTGPPRNEDGTYDYDKLDEYSARPP